IFSNRSKEKVLEIMKDSRIGTYGVLSLVLIIFLNISIIKELLILNSAFIIVFPIVGRSSGLLCSSLSNYARNDNTSLGKNFVVYCSFRELLIGLFFYFLFFFILLKKEMFLLSIVPLFVAFLLTKYFSKKIGGITGDIIGAVIELSQTFYLISSYIYFKN
ncbi:MAG: adenosylcobinamide-GDP ribazoletransferase, partial [Clostridiales bacterium]